MELIFQTFILFSCLMFWIMFFNKRGLLGQIKKVERSINQKVLVLEELAQKHTSRINDIKMLEKDFGSALIENEDSQKSISERAVKSIKKITKKIPEVVFENKNFSQKFNEKKERAKEVFGMVLKNDSAEKNQDKESAPIFMNSLKVDASSQAPEKNFSLSPIFQSKRTPSLNPVIPSETEERSLELDRIFELEVPHPAEGVVSKAKPIHTEEGDVEETDLAELGSFDRAELVDVSHIKEIKSFEDAVIYSKKIESQRNK